jgi:uncharacterized membrane protein YraQ (UPF0718 family)
VRSSPPPIGSSVTVACTYGACPALIGISNTLAASSRRITWWLSTPPCSIVKIAVADANGFWTISFAVSPGV